jgi:uncharacterized membrane protein
MSHRRDAGFSLFYAGELGALIGGYLCAVANGSMLTSGVQLTFAMECRFWVCCICNVDQFTLPNLTKQV